MPLVATTHCRSHPGPLTLGPREAVARLGALGSEYDKDNHSYHFPVGSQGLRASLTHGEVVLCG